VYDGKVQRMPQDIYAVVAIYDDHDYEDCYFTSIYDAERYARYRKQRVDFEWHTGMWASPESFNVDPRILWDNYEDAVAGFEKAFGPPKSGEERLAEINAKAVAEGRRHEMIMITKEQWEEFESWKAAHIDGNVS
jgi:hypothetical protein